ncbi:hypothetical protein ACJZ2D_010379 [Fusarium nematophilum]
MAVDSPPVVGNLPLKEYRHVPGPGHSASSTTLEKKNLGEPASSDTPDMDQEIHLLARRLTTRSWKGGHGPELFGDKGQRIDILRGLEGVVHAGEMLWVLGPPGSGCSTLPRTIAGDTYGFHIDARATLNYQGIRPEQMATAYRGEAISTAEVDHHFPHLTVGDTLYFAARARCPPTDKISDNIDRREYAEHLRDVIMAMFGISHTKHTRVGNDFVRGVSGGERKRATIAEAALGFSPLQCWDNSTRGLDSANFIEFCRNLKNQSDILGISSCVAIYQAPQAAYEVFDKVIALYEGRQIFFGKTDEARSCFETLGFVCPQQQTTPDFLTSMTNPVERIIRRGCNRTNTPDEFAQAWQSSQQRAQLLDKIDRYTDAHPFDGEHHQCDHPKLRHDWIGWIRWINPVFYGLESVFPNEFVGRQFLCSDLVPSGPSYSSLASGQFICNVAGSIPGQAFVEGKRICATEYISSERPKGEVLVFLQESISKRSKPRADVGTGRTAPPGSRRAGRATEDLHLATSTVGEVLTFSALLRQRAKYSEAEKIAYVDTVINLLNMSDYSDVIIGIPGEGLNVEQRKRLTIGVELVAGPQLLLFLDEPTSGLDSQTSWSICDLMEDLTKAGQAILCTIHQPSAMLFQRFGRLLLLAKGGKAVYFGEVGANSTTLMDYFVRNGGPALPQGVNPAEHMLAVIGAAPGAHTDIDWPAAWRSSREYHAVQSELPNLCSKEAVGSPTASGTSDHSEYRGFAATFIIQAREALFIGLSVMNANNTMRAPQNQIFGVFLFLTIFGQISEQLMPVFCEQRNFSFPSFCFICWYYPIGLYRNAEWTDEVHIRGICIFLHVWIFFLLASSFGHLMIAGAPNADIAGGIQNLLFIMMFIFCGAPAGPNAFLQGINVDFDHWWRNFGFLWAYVIFNTAGAVFLYWLVRVPKRARVKKE